MKLYKEIAIIVILVTSCMLFSGCISNNNTAEPETPTQDNEYQQGEGFAYQDAEIGCLFVVQGKDWSYERINDENRVLFYNKTDDVESENTIQLTSIEATDDPKTKIQTAWESLKDSMNVSYYESNNITVGGIYEGIEYDVIMNILNDKNTHGKITFWISDNTIYIIVMAYNDVGKDSVTKVYKGILESFSVYTGEG